MCIRRMLLTVDIELFVKLSCKKEENERVFLIFLLFTVINNSHKFKHIAQHFLEYAL